MARRLCLALAAGLCATAGLCLAAPTARAQQSGWELALGVPLSFQFTHDPQAPDPANAAFPVGLRATLLAPLRLGQDLSLGLGLGLAAYRTRMDNAGFPYAGRRVDYRLAELLAVVRYETGWVALGYGVGRATFDPVRAISVPLTQDYLPSDVQEWLVLAAFQVGERWDAVLGFHLLQTDARRTTNGAPATGALDGQLVSAGAGYRF
jgi:hypothetical protein